ncbi:hypothetical protein BO85DRAFT_463004 [Aspergillus piperis CBS 112811]|uniref:Uncharacterized protein n=1 Tax=Aspergillus piperis CBS 112811 TaxID=1448313 RepID=A0A8G1QWS9_9EURO|nr:hypothetical protein BO85DRAFT_463004 [Aspergillus piperis CBS 112811]RAH53610.1 hypothetical protein BO85DRAFT_463004 [Aspergillus piperis CBS 112811]
MRPKQMRSSAPSLTDRKKSISAGSQPGTRLCPSYCVWYFVSMFAWKGRRTNVPLSRQHFRGDDTHPTKINMGGWWLGRHTKVRPPPSHTIIMMLIGDGNCKPPKLRGEGDILPLPLWDTGGSRSYLIPFAADCPGLAWLFLILSLSLSLPASLVPLNLLPCLLSPLSALFSNLLVFVVSLFFSLDSFRANTASVLLLIADLLKLLVLAYIYQIYSHWGTAHWTFPSLLFCSRALFPSMYLVQTLDQSASTGLGRLFKQFSSGSKL